MELVKEFHFEAAHALPNVAPGHKCARVHGHSYRIRIHFVGDVDPTSGMVIDFAEIDAAAAPLVSRLDHRLLNDIDGLENPTSELLAIWIWERLNAALPGLSCVTVSETASSSCSYRGPR